MERREQKDRGSNGNKVPYAERVQVIEDALTAFFPSAPRGGTGAEMMREFVKILNLRMRHGEAPRIGEVKSKHLVRLAREKAGYYQEILKDARGETSDLNERLDFWRSMENCSAQLYRITHPDAGVVI